MIDIHTIKTAKEYEAALEAIDQLLDAEENSKEADCLEILSILVEDYENKHHAIALPDPIEAINFRLEQLGLSRKSLENAIGSRGRVSEVMNRKRNLTLPMIRKLHLDFNIPAEILIAATKKKTA